MPHKRKKKLNKEVSLLKIGKKKRKRLEFRSALKKKCLMIKNLSYKATDKAVEEYLHKFGKVSNVQLLKKSNGNLTGRGIIEFKNDKGAAEAIKSCNGKEFMGRKIVVDWITPQPESKKTSKKLKKKSKLKIAVKKEEEKESETEENVVKAENGDEEVKTKKSKQQKKKDRLIEENVVKAESGNEEVKTKKSKQQKKKDRLIEENVVKSETGNEEVKTKKSKQQKKKDRLSEENVVKAESGNEEVKTKKSKQQKKKARLIVRNLPFKVTEANLTDHFKKFGDISEVTLLRRSDGKLVGCGFVQFTNKNCAAKAILECSGKPLLGRPVVVDWAVPKSTFKAADKPEETKIKEEPDDETEEGKPSLDNAEKDEIVEVKQESSSSDESDEESDDEEDEESDDDDESESDAAETSEDKPDVGKQKVVSNDVSEGRTVFIKNVPFSVTNEELKTCMEQFGQVIYALVCIDPDTEHPKGTAFVKFQKKESAEECLSAGTELVLHDQVLDAHRALNKEDLQKKTTEKHKDKVNKDSRNLYLVKEGVVVAGSRAAAGVSMTDMSRRLKLEQSKSQLLRNLNMYVSRVRLVVHNLPQSWDDAKLRQLFSSHGGPNAVIREARIMRDFKNVDAEGVGKSKEYGFVSFMRHENALHALRNINNNPDIFTPAKRPIVSFSIENKAILNIKQKRLERSQARNPFYSEKPVTKKSDRSQKPDTTENEAEVEEKEAFVGVTSKPGNVKMRNRFKLQTQAKIHSQMVHKAKLKQKKKTGTEQRMKIAKERMKEPQMKKGAKRKHDEEDGTFSTLVNKYKKQLMVAPTKKWYE